MFNFQGSELMIILLLALVVLGPEKLPEAMRRLGRFYADLRKMSSGFQQEFKAAVDEPMRELRETANVLRDSADFRKLANGEREEKPKSAEMAAVPLAKPDPDQVPTDDLPFGQGDGSLQPPPATATPADAPAPSAFQTPPTGTPMASPTGSPVPAPSGAPAPAPFGAPSGPAVATPRPLPPTRPVTAPAPFSSSQMISARAPQPPTPPPAVNGSTTPTADAVLPRQEAVEDESGLRESRPAATEPTSQSA